MKEVRELNSFYFFLFPRLLAPTTDYARVFLLSASAPTSGRNSPGSVAEGTPSLRACVRLSCVRTRVRACEVERKKKSQELKISKKKKYRNF